MTGRDPPTVCIVTFGCQMNKLDSQLLRGQLVRYGFGLSDEPDRADVVLYNTCSVRAHAEDRVFSHLGAYRGRAEGEDGFILGVIGCMAQRLGRGLVDRFGFVRLVCGTRALLRVPEHLQRIMAGGGAIVDVEEDGPFLFRRMPKMRAAPHRAYVSVMRGCDNFCSYCIVPYVRGREVSRPAGGIVEEVEVLAAEGVREVILLGQNVNSYGKGLEEPVTLADVLALVNDVEGLERIRFVTSHPKDMSDAILDAVGGLDKVCEHLHVPAQSGSDAVLRRMNRAYTAAQYREMVERARRKIRGVELASDFMVGFPGETDADFEDTLRLLGRWPDDVPDEVKRERNLALLAAQERFDARRRSAMIGRQVEVLVDGPSKGDAAKLSGRTRQNDIVVFEGGKDLIGRLCMVRIVDSTPLTLFGEPAAKHSIDHDDTTSTTSNVKP